jgi:hypothetical protein
MDPKAALDMICDLVIQGEIDEAKQNARDLERWLTRGGFYPELDADASRVIIAALLTAIQMK